VRFSLFEEPAPLPELIRNAVWVTASKSDRNGYYGLLFPGFAFRFRLSGAW
jgi:hypothetical protein